MQLRLRTRWKIAALRWMGKRFEIPITIQEHALPELIEQSIDAYIHECCYILKHVYDASPVTINNFIERTYDYMLANKFQPMLLHDHPLYYAGMHVGIVPGELDHQVALDDAEQRHTELCKNDKTYNRQFVKGWRLECGLQRFRAQGT